MSRLLMVAAVIFIMVMVLPELRTLMLVGAFCWFGGFVGGTQHRAKHDAELHANRLERGVQTWQS